jgi:prepilin-type N-terminal cleavage/methylation domain-containing protein
MKVGNRNPLEETAPGFQGKMRVLSGSSAQQGLVDAKKASPGFTLIELTIVLVVIGILAAIAIPNYVLMTSRAKESKVKENAHCVQLAAELYATQNDGIYAGADEGSIVADIVPSLPGQQRLKNPFSGNRTEPIVGPAANPGEIGYQVRVGAGGINEGYIITGFGRTAMVMTLNGGF